MPYSAVNARSTFPELEPVTAYPEPMNSFPPAMVAPGALIELGESALRVVPAVPAQLGRAEVVPDGQGAVHVSTRTTGSTPRPEWARSASLAGHTAAGTGSLPEPGGAHASHLHTTHGRGFRVGA